MLTRVTDTIIEELTDATCGDTRSRHFFLHALHGLVRVAKAEQLREMRLDVALATGESVCPRDAITTPESPHKA